MPATDSTYRNMRRLHAVFAASSLALVAVTVWMLAADHWREWKVYQRTFRDRIEPWLTEAQISESQTDEFTARERELRRMLSEARAAVPDRKLVQQFCEEVKREALRRGTEPAEVAGIEEAYQALAAGPSAEAGRELVALLSEHIAAAKARLEKVERQLRFRRADFDHARSFYEAGVGEGLSETELAALQEEVRRTRQDVDQLAAQSEAAAAHHQTLSGLLARITRQKDEAQQALADHRAAVERLGRVLAEQRPSFGKGLLRLPLVDAFGRPLAIDQIWLPELTIDYNFRRVARFDRCVTCHQGIDKTVPGSPSVPACLAEELLTVELAVPSEPGQRGEEEGGAAAGERATTGPTLKEVYGLSLAPRGMLKADEPTIGLVVPRTAAADAGLLAGDVILKINGTRIADANDARRRLLEAALNARAPGEDQTCSARVSGPRRPVSRSADRGATWSGEAEGLKIEIRRGLAHPYSSHPRLDLFVGSLSPHPMSEFGCTICHGGQGSATEFKFASHTPNDPQERARWRAQHGWFWNRHWDFPMLPERFLESGCLKCHHAVTDLAPSERFADSPAPKLLAGYHLVRQNGCFGCHEIKGVTGSGERIGPDMRLEPRYHEAALDLLGAADLSDKQRSLARQVVEHPEDPEPRRRLVASLGADRAGDASSTSARVTAARAAAVKVLAAEDPTPGTMRKVGPSLRDVAGKLDAVFMENWLRNPPAVRPDTRMPQLYGLQDYLDGKSLDDAKRFEAVEVYAVTEYLLGASRPVEPLDAPPEVTEPPSAERGKRLFLTQGCVACHRHEDFPRAQSIHGPNLSNLGAKLSTETGRSWLVRWIRDPARHSPRTLMPNTLLEPTPLARGEEDADQANQANTPDRGADRDAEEAELEASRPPTTDPAADIAAYLLEAPRADDGRGVRRPLVESDLDELALLHLSNRISRRRAEAYLRGDFELTAEEAQGDAVELVGRVTPEKKVRYVGRRTIRKRGCYGCHDIPGFVDAQPIGPVLSDWGRKQESLLAFEQVHQFLANAPRGPRSDAGKDPDRGFYLEAVFSHRREGFIWQKLRGPRSFDYKKADNKGYNEWLTMGRFSFTPDQREAIITFVLGLVADPPAEKYVCRGDPHRRAIAEGRKVIDRYGCAECHTLEMERWQIQYDPDQIEGPFEVEDYAFLKPQVDLERLETSTKPDPRGLLHAEAVGMPQMDEWGEVLEDVDDDDKPMLYLNLWEPLSLKVQDDWKTWTVGGAQLGVSDPREVASLAPGRAAAARLSVEEQKVRPTYTPHLAATRAPVGGAFARLLFPNVLDEDNPAVMEAWGWVPPPLVDEGRKVQPAWLHDYLLDPVPIRPAAVLRMPKYTMSSEEAGKLVDYFAAVAGAEFPYSSHPRSRSAGLEAKELERPHRLDDAMRIVIDRVTYCTKCHLVGDFSPGGEIRTVLAPRLDHVASRVRPEYLRRWLANPKSLLPYTGMPVNFPPTGPPMGQDLFQGSSIEQLDAVMDLLLNYDWYINRRTSIREMIESAERAKAGAETDSTE